MLVEKMMHTPVFAVQAETSIFDAMQFAEEKKVRHLPVLDGDELVGIVTDRDFRAACPSSLFGETDRDMVQTTPVRSIMHFPVITAHSLEFFDEAIKRMYDMKIGCLPVISQGQLVGIVTEIGVLSYLINMLGVLTPGSYMEVEIDDKPGVLADIANIIKDHNINLSSVLLCPTRDDGRKFLIMRLEALNISKITEEIQSAGYKIVFPSPAGG